MGQGKRRYQAKLNALIADINRQTNEDVVQCPIQLSDGWYRGVQSEFVGDILNYWDAIANGRELWVYYINKFWVHQSWKTHKGNHADRGDLILTVNTNAVAKQLWQNTVSQPHVIDNYRDQLEAVKQRENGCVQFWWLRRYLLCRASLGLQKMPVNQWDYYPLVQVFYPDGTTAEQALDLADIEQHKTLFQDPKEVASAAPWELDVFRNCITEEIVE
jgi:hypothetical protein